jgi:hypothetical protein
VLSNATTAICGTLYEDDKYHNTWQILLKEAKEFKSIFTSIKLTSIGKERV